MCALRHSKPPGWPRYDEAATARIVTVEPEPEGYLFEVLPFADLIRAGRPIYR